MLINENIKVSKYEKNRSKQYVDPEGKYPSLARLATEALKEFNDKLEKEAEKK